VCAVCCVHHQVKLSKVSRAFSAWKLLHKPMTGQAEAPQNWEDMLPGEDEQGGGVKDRLLGWPWD
jgi:hypothetical protein